MSIADEISDLNPANAVQKIVAYLVAAILIFMVGYGLRWHQDSLRDAKRETTEKVATAGVQAGGAAVDTVAISALQMTNDDLKRQNTFLQSKLKEAQSANPPSSVCRLPDGVLSEFNRQLSTDQPDPPAVVR